VRSRKLLAIPALVAALVPSCAEPPADPGSGVVIGAILPLSGPDGESGRDLLRGLELAAAAADPPITLLPVDGEGKAATSARRLRELARDPLVDVVVGGWLASTARTLAAVASAEAVPFIALSPLAGPSIAVPGSDLFLLHRLEALGQASAVFAREDLGAESAGVFWIEGSAASRALADAFAREFAAGGGEIAWTLAPDGAGRLALPRGPEAKVEALYVGGPSDWAERVVELAGRSRGAAVLLADGWRLDSVEALVAADIPVYLAGFFSETDPLPPARALLDACAAAEVPPSPAVAFGWDAVQLVRYSAAGGTTRGALRGALRVSDAVHGATGRVGHAIPSRTRETPAVSSAMPGGFVFVRRVEVGPPAPATGA
jgi:ABC-type branched-subunit amino acid transport system substrate-binding protein